MTTFYQSPSNQVNDLINSINQMKSIKSPSNRLRLQTSSQISQYFNLEYKTFSSPTNSNHLNSSIDKNKKPFPSFSTERQTSPRINQMIGSRRQNFKQSHIQQSLQKAFSLNRNSQRIPFKKKQSNSTDLNFLQAEKRSYNFYEPQYSDYYLKQDKNFWTQTLEKFNEKKGFSQTLDFPSFNQKEHSKISQRNSELNKLSEAQKQEKTKKLQKHVSKTIIWSSFVVVIIFLIGLKLFFPK